MIGCYISDGKLYGLNRQVLAPDNSGIVEVEISGTKRRFLYSKFFEYIQNNPSQAAPPKPKLGRPRIHPVRTTQKRKYTKGKVKPVREYKGQWLKNSGRRGIKITAAKGAETFGPYISLRQCSRAINVSVKQLKTGLNGGSCKGFTVKYA